MRLFTKEDWHGLMGAEKCHDDTGPFIGELTVRIEGKEFKVLMMVGGAHGKAHVIALVGDGREVPFQEYARKFGPEDSVAFVRWVAERMENAGAMDLNQLVGMGFEHTA